MKLCLFVNGSFDSVTGIRARGLTGFIDTNYKTELLYRDKRKTVSIIKFFNFARKTRPDLIYVVSIGYSGIFAAIAAKLLFGPRLIVDTGDAVYELLKTMGNVGFLQTQLVKLLEQAAFKYSDVIIVQGSSHKKWLEKRGYKNVFHIPNGVAASSVNPVNGSNLRKKLGLEHYFIVGVMGSIVWSNKLEMCYGWDLIEALSLLKELPVKGIIVGDGTGLPKLRELARQKGIEDRVIFTGHLPYSEIHDYLYLMDVCLSTQTNNLAGEVRTTAKLPEYLACGRYVIATEVGDAKYILPGIGMLLPYEGTKDDNYPLLLAEKIRWLLENRKELEKGQAGVQLAKEKFDYSVLAGKLEKVLTEVISK